jgi:nucleotide-binding universal stress UspA family protein
MLIGDVLVVDQLDGGFHLLRWAALIAQQNSARLRLVSHVPRRRDSRCVAASPGAAIDRLEHRARPLRARGIEVTTGVIVDDGHEGIVREALRCSSDLVVKSVEPCGRLAALAGAHPERRLLRCSPCPVWLVPEGAWGDGPVLAAVNPQDDDGADVALDARVLEAASAVADWFQTGLHVVHAWSVPLMPMLGRTAVDPRRDRRAIEEGAASAAVRIQRCVARARLPLPRERVHLVRGHPHVVLPEVAAEVGAQVVVVGTVARSGLAGLLRANVAEQVLPGLRCSLLVLHAAPARRPEPLHRPAARRRLWPVHS